MAKKRSLPKVSVLMSVYNSSRFIIESVESILGQTFKDFEFIIVNDCSTDNSLNIIKKYAKQDKRIVLIKNKKNIGLTKSLNKGLKIARGKYIARIDADDISLPNRLQTQYQFLEENPDIFLAGSGAIIIDSKGKEIGKYEPITCEEKLKKVLETKNAIYHSTIMFRNEKNNFYREKFYYAQDYDFYLRILLEKKRLINNPDILIKYRISSQSISFSKIRKQKLFAEKARKFYLQEVRGIENDYKIFNPNKILNTSNDKNVQEVLYKIVICKIGKLKFLRKIYQKAF